MTGRWLSADLSKNDRFESDLTPAGDGDALSSALERPEVIAAPEISSHNSQEFSAEILVSASQMVPAVSLVVEGLRRHECAH